MTTREELSAEVRRQIEARQLRAAADSCDRLNEQFPDYDYGWFVSSQLAVAIHKPELGLRAIDRAIALNPDKPEWLFQRLHCLSLAGHVAEAREMAAQLTAFQFSTPAMSADFAMILTRLGMHKAAIRHYRRAAELKSDDPDLYMQLAAGERTLGNIDGALDALDKCLALAPEDAGALFLRSTLRRQTSDDNNIAELESVIERISDRAEDVVRVRYALTKEYEDLERFEEAFAHLQQGADLLRGHLQYDLQHELDTMRTVRDMFGEAKFDGSIAGHINADPIFIIGMPRTGTAIVDQILRGHPVVQSAGSTMAFTDALTRQCFTGDQAPPKSVPEMLARAANADFEAVGEAYLRSARPATGEIAHFVDSLPMNFLYAGIIHLALPKAKIVVLERDAMDTCFFAYRTLFEGAFPFSYDLDEIAGFYSGYREHMAHWQAVIPGVMHTVRYEDLVSDPRPVIEDLLEYCGLSFDASCLSFWDDEHVSVRGEPQPSRRETYMASIGMWKHYEKQLAALREKLSV